MTPDLHPDLDEMIQYCMGTLDAASAERLRAHAEQCAECRAEIARMQKELALASMAVPQVAPPAGAKNRLFAAAGLDLPQTSQTAGMLAGKTAETTPVADGKVVSIESRRTSPVLTWAGWIAAAACLFYAVQVREANQGMLQQLRTETAQIVQSKDSSARAKEVMEVLSSPQAQRVTLVAAHAKPEPSGHAVYLPSRGALVFTASNLHPLPANKTYELWVIPANGSNPVPAGTFQPDAKGMASVLLPNLPHGIQAKAFGVTMENAGGASKPTMPILLAGG